jgi:hypothetical protein
VPRVSLLTLVARTTLALALLGLGGCDGSPTDTGLGAACGDGPLFTALPVALADMALVSVVGGLGAPGHTLPTAHSGIILAREGAPVTVPGDMEVRELRRVTYVSSPTREGETDYSLNFRACRDVEGWFGHLTTLAAPILEGVSWSNCQTYSTSDELVENCFATPRMTLAAGDPMGTGGWSIAQGHMGLDVGLVDYRVEHFYAAPWRYPVPMFHAVCPWEYFDVASRDALFSRLADPSRPDVTPAGEPRCGTMAVDVAGTAKGVWADPTITAPVAGDERRYITLADYPYRPQQELALSLGPAELGATVAVVPRLTTGRVNRAFEDVTADGQIHCYTSNEPWHLGSSWYVSLQGAASLRIERIQHAHDASPCAADPSTWSYGAGAVDLVR